MQVVFTPEWDEDGETYFSDYRAYGSEEKQVWTFQVKNQVTENPVDPIDLSNAELNLHLDGMYNVYDGVDKPFTERLAVDNSKKEALILVDVDDQRSYSYEELQTARLTMEGLHTRTFRWVLGTVEEKDYEPLASAQRAASRTDEAFKSASSHSSRGTFGLPPQ